MGYVDFDATLRNFDGDLEVLKAISQIFLEDAPEILADLKRHVQAEDVAKTSESLHKLKGLVANFHATQLVEKIAKSESAAREGQLIMNGDDTDQIAKEIATISGELRNYFAGKI
jgi:HPt (histidine-containing phosphotransfer) domain-containing protein